MYFEYLYCFIDGLLTNLGYISVVVVEFFISLVECPCCYIYIGVPA
jgi:hypothetical protein